MKILILVMDNINVNNIQNENNINENGQIIKEKNKENKNSYLGKIHDFLMNPQIKMKIIEIINQNMILILIMKKKMMNLILIM